MIAKRSLDLLKDGIARRLFSGAGFALLSKKRSSGIGTIGRLAFDTETDRVNRDTLFDIASLTKPLATSMAILQLVDDGKVTLDLPIADYFERDSHLTGITVRHLLTHTSGLPPIPTGDAQDSLESAFRSELKSTPGSAYVYSDTGYILLGEIVNKASGITLDEWFTARIASPLYLTNSGFHPELSKPIAATSDDETLDGLPHDPLAREMDGVAGHAGLFMSIDDIAAYARALLGSGKALLSEAAFNSLFAPAIDPAIGCQTSAFFTIGNAYMPDTIGFSQSRVGHSGFTGCFMIIDRETENSACLLTNRVLNTTSDQAEFLKWRNLWLSAAAIDLGL
jgi:CubicO group peptidase (beta-lactamase class C family)